MGLENLPNSPIQESSYFTCLERNLRMWGLGLRNKSLGLDKWRKRAWVLTPSGVYAVEIAGTINGLAGVCVLNGRLDPGLVRTYTSA